MLPRSQSVKQMRLNLFICMLRASFFFNKRNKWQMCTERKQCLCVFFILTLQCQPYPYCKYVRSSLWNDTDWSRWEGRSLGFCVTCLARGRRLFFRPPCLKWVPLEAAGGLWFCSLKFSSISSKQYVCHQVHPSQQTGAIVVLNLTCLQSRSWQQMMKCSNVWRKKTKKQNKSLSFRRKVPVLCLVWNLAFFFSFFF